MNSFLTFIVRIVLGGLFLISGIAKVLDPIRFLFTLRDFRLFPGIIEPWLALFLPWFEVVLGLFMVLGLFLRTCSLLLGILNVTFMAAILSVIVRGIEIDCGCFGLLADILHLPDMADYKAVVRNLVFIGMCAYLYRAEGAFLTLDRLIIHRRGDRESA
jgi:putative oxidoreductase